MGNTKGEILIMVRNQLVCEQRECVCDGVGKAEIAHWLSAEELCPNLKFLSTITLKKGASVGDHSHTGEAEVYFMQKGTGEYNDNGKTVLVKAGDVTVCYDGECHGLKNIGDGEFVFYAAIIKG
ncbi:MAG: cupin domain-containing protein [Christensenellaceae bacterium]